MNKQVLYIHVYSKSPKKRKRLDIKSEVKNTWVVRIGDEVLQKKKLMNLTQQ